MNIPKFHEGYFSFYLVIVVLEQLFIYCSDLRFIQLILHVIDLMFFYKFKELILSVHHWKFTDV